MNNAKGVVVKLAQKAFSSMCSPFFLKKVPQIRIYGYGIKKEQSVIKDESNEALFSVS